MTNRNNIIVKMAHAVNRLLDRRTESEVGDADK